MYLREYLCRGHLWIACTLQRVAGSFSIISLNNNTKMGNTNETTVFYRTFQGIIVQLDSTQCSVWFCTWSCAVSTKHNICKKIIDILGQYNLLLIIVMIQIEPRFLPIVKWSLRFNVIFSKFISCQYFQCFIFGKECRKRVKLIFIFIMTMICMLIKEIWYIFIFTTSRDLHDKKLVSKITLFRKSKFETEGEWDGSDFLPMAIGYLCA